MRLETRIYTNHIYIYTQVQINTSTNLDGRRDDLWKRGGERERKGKIRGERNYVELRSLYYEVVSIHKRFTVERKMWIYNDSVSERSSSNGLLSPFDCSSMTVLKPRGGGSRACMHSQRK